MVLTGTSSPGIKFPSAAQSGLKINLSKPVVIVGGATTTLLVDFDVNDSFVLRGNTITQNGLLFKPVVNATIVDAATVNATVRLANATDAALDLRQGTSVASGGSNLAFAGISSCTSVTAASPRTRGSADRNDRGPERLHPDARRRQQLHLRRVPRCRGTTSFATLVNTFTPTTGQAGFRVFNATGGATALDAFVATQVSLFTTPTVSGAASGAATAFVSVPAGTMVIRVTSTGLLPPLFPDLVSQTLNAGTNYTLVIAPPASGQTNLRAFLVAGC